MIWSLKMNKAETQNFGQHIVKREIIEVLDDSLVELKKEILYKKEEIKEIEEEMEENEEYEMPDDELDENIDGCYDEVLVIGTKYTMSEILKGVNKSGYEDMRDDFSNNHIEERRDELETEIDNLKEELEELEENYEEEFENED